MCLCAQLCLTVCNPTDCSLPGSSVREISQARRILERVTISDSRRSSRPWIEPVSVSPASAGGFFTASATWEAHILCTRHLICIILFTVHNILVKAVIEPPWHFYWQLHSPYPPLQAWMLLGASGNARKESMHCLPTDRLHSPRRLCGGDVKCSQGTVEKSDR